MKLAILICGIASILSIAEFLPLRLPKPPKPIEMCGDNMVVDEQWNVLRTWPGNRMFCGNTIHVAGRKANQY